MYSLQPKISEEPLGSSDISIAYSAKAVLIGGQAIGCKAKKEEGSNEPFLPLLLVGVGVPNLDSVLGAELHPHVEVVGGDVIEHRRELHTQRRATGLRSYGVHEVSDALLVELGFDALAVVRHEFEADVRLRCATGVLRATLIIIEDFLGGDDLVVLEGDNAMPLTVDNVIAEVVDVCVGGVDGSGVDVADVFVDVADVFSHFEVLLSNSAGSLPPPHGAGYKREAYRVARPSARARKNFLLPQQRKKFFPPCEPGRFLLSCRRDGGGAF